jgi:hypothetical protein
MNLQLAACMRLLCGQFLPCACVLVHARILFRIQPFSYVIRPFPSPDRCWMDTYDYERTQQLGRCKCNVYSYCCHRMYRVCVSERETGLCRRPGAILFNCRKKSLSWCCIRHRCVRAVVRVCFGRTSNATVVLPEHCSSFCFLV